MYYIKLHKVLSHASMLAYLVMHMQVGMRTQTRTEIAIQSVFVYLCILYLYFCICMFDTWEYDFC